MGVEQGGARPSSERQRLRAEAARREVVRVQQDYPPQAVGQFYNLWREYLLSMPSHTRESAERAADNQVFNITTVLPGERDVLGEVLNKGRRL